MATGVFDSSFVPVQVTTVSKAVTVIVTAQLGVRSSR